MPSLPYVPQNDLLFFEIRVEFQAISDKPDAICASPIPRPWVHPTFLIQPALKSALLFGSSSPRCVYTSVLPIRSPSFPESNYFPRNNQPARVVNFRNDLLCRKCFNPIEARAHFFESQNLRTLPIRSSK